MTIDGLYSVTVCEGLSVDKVNKHTSLTVTNVNAAFQLTIGFI